MEALGITEKEMVKYYYACGSEGERRNEALADIIVRFKLNAEDASFVEGVLGDCGPF